LADTHKIKWNLTYNANSDSFRPTLFFFLLSTHHNDRLLLTVKNSLDRAAQQKRVQPKRVLVLVLVEGRDAVAAGQRGAPVGHAEGAAARGARAHRLGATRPLLLLVKVVRAVVVRRLARHFVAGRGRSLVP